TIHLTRSGGDTSAALAVLLTLALNGPDLTPADFYLTGESVVRNGDQATVTFAPGQTAADFTLTALGDGTATDQNTLRLTLNRSASFAYATGDNFGRDSATVTIAGTTVVTNTNDAGAGSLRRAVANANAVPGPDTITFAGPAFSSPATITLTSDQLFVNDS